MLHPLHRHLIGLPFQPATLEPPHDGHGDSMATSFVTTA